MTLRDSLLAKRTAVSAKNELENVNLLWIETKTDLREEIRTRSSQGADGAV